MAKTGKKVNTKTALLFLHIADKIFTSSLESEICDCFSISEREPEQSKDLILQKVS